MSGLAPAPPADVARAAWRASPAGYGLKLVPGYQLWRHTAAISRAYVQCMSTPGSRLIINVQNQIGKGLDVETPIATPNGWRRMGDLAAGDTVFGGDGQPCRVTHAWPERFLDCYRVELHDGGELVVDGDHLWRVWAPFDADPTTPIVRLPGTVRGRRTTGYWRVVDTREVVRRPRRYAVPRTPAITTASVPLPVDPYVLGAWLGDGSSNTTSITCADDGILGEIRSAGYLVRKLGDRLLWSISDPAWENAMREARKLREEGRSIAYIARVTGIGDRTIRGRATAEGWPPGPAIERLDQVPVAPRVLRLGTILNRLGVLGNKHIPDRYLWAGDSQRLALLQGLMDTDGYVDLRATGYAICEFTSTNRRLAAGVRFFARSLGIKAKMSEGRATLRGKDCGPKWRVTFTTDVPVFRLERKRKLLADSLPHKPARTVGFKSLTRIPSVPTRCIAVDSPDQTFLAGESMTVTHNSLCTSILGPDWILDHWPHLRVMLIAHGIDFATKFGRRARNLVVDNPEVFRQLEIVGGREAAEKDWHTTAGGGMFSTSIYRVAGNPADRMIIDDPYAGWKEAHSEVTLESVWEAWESDVQGRIRPETSVCLTMTRYNAGDLTGRLTDPKRNPEWKRWRVLRIPALAEDLADPLGRRPGETIDERCRPRDFMLARKATTSSYLWAGMYQQRPSPAGGGIVKRSWWKRYSMRPGLPRFDEIIQSWDMAFKETKTSSYVVGQVWGRMGGDFYLLDQVRDRMDFPSTIVAVTNLSSRWPMARAKLVEDKANGPAVIATLARQVPGLIAVQVEGSKEARLHAVSSYIESGNVFLPDDRLAPWIGDFIEELAMFPKGADDDQVDACSQALERLAAGVGIQSDYAHEGGRR